MPFEVTLRYGITRLLDAPCGGVHSSWMNSTLRRIKEEIPCFTYLGVDVVPSVVKKNRESFSMHSSWTFFAEMDLSEGNHGSQKNGLSSRNSNSNSMSSRNGNSSGLGNPVLSSLPSGFQLLLSRDALQHLSYAAIAGVLQNYCLSGAAYLLVGSYILEQPGGQSKNKDIAVGETFSIDLLRAPFNFRDPLVHFDNTAVMCL